MAIETTTTSVLPDMETYSIEEYEGFGWELVSSQRTTNDKGVVVINLTFSRDMEMKNYDKLKLMFDSYMEKEEEMNEIYRQKVRMGEEPSKLKFNILAALCSALFGGFGLICYIVVFNLKNKRIKKEIIEYNKKFNALLKRFNMLEKECEELLVEAKTLL